MRESDREPIQRRWFRKLLKRLLKGLRPGQRRRLGSLVTSCWSAGLRRMERTSFMSKILRRTTFRKSHPSPTWIIFGSSSYIETQIRNCSKRSSQTEVSKDQSGSVFDFLTAGHLHRDSVASSADDVVDRRSDRRPYPVDLQQFHGRSGEAGSDRLKPFQ